MEIYYSQKNSKITFDLVGELDEFCAEKTKEYLDKVILDNKPQEIVFDLKRLSFTESTGIGDFIGRYKTAKNIGCKTFITNTSRAVDKIFTMAGIYGIIPKISWKEQKWNQ